MNGKEARAPHPSKTRKSAPFHLTWLPSLTTLEMQRQVKRMHVSGHFRRSELLDFPGGGCFQITIADLHLEIGTILTFFIIQILCCFSKCFNPYTRCSISLPETLPRHPSIRLPPTFAMLPTFGASNTS